MNKLLVTHIVKSCFWHLKDDDATRSCVQLVKNIEHFFRFIDIESIELTSKTCSTFNRRCPISPKLFSKF